MVLVDSSSWVEALRKSGQPDVKQRVQELLSSGQAAWCEMIRLELWNGARGQYESKAIRRIDRLVANLAIDPQVWEMAVALARRARDGGLTVPAADLIICACAIRHRVAIEHNDRHLARLEALSQA